MYRVFVLGLMIVLLGFQFRLWFGDGGIRDILAIEVRIDERRHVNALLYSRNEKLAGDILELRHGLGFVEELARLDLGMIREGEDFYVVYESN